MKFSMMELRRAVVRGHAADPRIRRTKTEHNSYSVKLLFVPVWGAESLVIQSVRLEFI